MKNNYIFKEVRPLIGFLIVLAIFICFSASASATNYYVSSTASNRSDSNTGLKGYPWKTIAKVNGLTFAAGDTVFFEGSFAETITDPGIGSSTNPIVFKGTGPNSGRAVISGINLTNSKYVNFLNFEASGNGGVYGLVKSTSTGNIVQFIRFENLYLYNAMEGVDIGNIYTKDITFVNTTITNMKQDGVMLSDKAGDRFSYIGGSITNTGNVSPGWGTHGCYASGGTGHLFDGVTFKDNANGWAISIRRGGMTIRNCQFLDVASTGYINNNNEDEATGINHYTGSRAKNQYYMIYHNLFVGGVAIYQSDKLNNGTDLGCDDPGNTWAVFNNTFVNTTINFSGTATTNYSRFFDIYMRNNAFVNTSVSVGAANSGKEHVLTNNGWYSSTYNGGSTYPGTGNLTTTPSLDGSYNVTAAAYRNVGTKDIAPIRTDKDMTAVTMVTDLTSPLFYFGTAPDMGKNEYGESSNNNNILLSFEITEPINVNGQLDEVAWAEVNAVSFSNSSRSDNSVIAYSLWDDNFLYYAFDVHDANLETGASAIWNNDAIEIYIDRNHDETISINTDDYQYIVSIDESIGYFHSAQGGNIIGKVITNSNGYTMEIAIPWSQIGMVPADEKIMGLLMANDDKDLGISSSYDWLNIIETGGYARPNLWGNLKLVAVLEVLPTVTTTSASAITQTTATSGGNVTSDGGATITARGVCWSTSSNPTISNSKTSNGTGIGSFTSSITGLTAGTTYYVRAYATNSVGTAYGSQISFTTLPQNTIPTVTTTSISSITQTTATSGGNVTSDGGATITARGVCWSTTSNPTISDSKTSDGTGTGSYTSSITGLSAGTTYYVRTYATNSVGTSYGSQVSFTTTTASVPTTYYEDFSDGVANNISAISGTWAVESNQYSQSNTANTNTIASVPVTQSGKYVYQWTVNYVSSSAAGMHFYCTSSNGTGRGNSYLVFQTNTMLQIYESVGDVLTKKAEASCTAATGETHSYLVIYDPATGLINVYRDGSTSPIVTWTDATPLIAGSYISLRTNNTHTHFDNISVDYALYSEDFSDATANNFVASSGTWAVESNQYSQSNTSNANTIASVPVIQYGKLVYEWKTAFITSTSAGMHIICDASTGDGRGNSYLVFQTSTMLQIYESINNVLTKKAEASCTSAAGQSHTYKVTYDPSTGLITAYRDGGTTAIVSWTDSTPLTAGSYISLRTNSTHAHFDDLSVNIYNNTTKSALASEEISISDEITVNCYPNPFSSNLTISYNVPEEGNVLIEIYDFTGKAISKVVDENQVSGNYNVTWNSDESLTNGIYFCRIVVNENVKNTKLLLLK